jgi:hypothetical protein
MPSKALVLDANILIRAVLGRRVRHILESHVDSISFFIPETAYAERGQAGWRSREGGALAAFDGCTRNGRKPRPLRGLRSGGSKTAGGSRPARLADSRCRIGARLSDLDGRH